MANLSLQLSVLFFCLVLPGLLIGPLPAMTQDAQMPPEDPVVWSLKVTPATAKAGGKFTAQVMARIEKGWHLYSLEQEEGGPIPTRIKLPTGQSFEMAGEIESPTPRTLFDKNFNLNTEFYEGEATFTLPVKVLAKTAAGQQKLSVQVRYQCCNDSLCLPPKIVKLETDITIRAGK